MIDQYADQPCRVWAAYLYALYRADARQLARPDAEVDLTWGQARERIECQLQLVLTSLDEVGELRRQRSRQVRRDEDITGRIQRVGDAVIGALLEEAEHTTLQQQR